MEYIERYYSDKKTYLIKKIRSTFIWKFASNLKLSLKRMKLSSPYRDRFFSLNAFRFFMNVEELKPDNKILNTFHYKDIWFDLRPMEWHLMQAILLEEEYGGKVIQHHEDTPPTLIIDAGANVGVFSVFALSTWKNVKVFSVEPVLDTFNLLKHNQEKNPMLDWHVFQYAFWEKDGTVQLEDQGSSMAAHITATSGTSEVTSIQLDHFIENNIGEERISFLKMDIEGAELATLTASRKILARVDAMVIEIHSHLCDENSVRSLLKEEFPFLYDLPAKSTKYPIVFACRQALD